MSDTKLGKLLSKFESASLKPLSKYHKDIIELNKNRKTGEKLINPDNEIRDDVTLLDKDGSYLRYSIKSKDGKSFHLVSLEDDGVVEFDINASDLKYLK